MAPQTPASKAAKPTVEDENDDQEDWKSDGEPVSPQEIKDILEIAEKTNKLLKALLSHPKMDRNDLTKSPRPLYWAADFVRRTYMEYLLPMMPRDAVIKSSRFANEYMFGYEGDNHIPTEPADAYLNDPENWSKDSSTSEMYTDAVGRHMTICLALTDDMMGQMVLQGHFNWVNPVNIRALAEELSH